MHVAVVTIRQHIIGVHAGTTLLTDYIVLQQGHIQQIGGATVAGVVSLDVEGQLTGVGVDGTLGGHVDRRSLGDDVGSPSCPL